MLAAAHESTWLSRWMTMALAPVASTYEVKPWADARDTGLSAYGFRFGGRGDRDFAVEKAGPERR